MTKSQSKNKPAAAPVAPFPAKVKRTAPSLRWWAVLLSVVAFLVYANTLKNGFVLDDHIVIKDNFVVREGVKAIPKIMTTPYLSGWSNLDNDLYRPLSLVMFAVECQLWGQEAAPFHFMNVLVFAGCVVLLFFFLNRLMYGKRTGVAFVAALLFAVHPLHTEVVANIKSRDELLCFLFAFLSLNVLVGYMETGKLWKLAMGALCYGLALLSKETAITWLVIVPVVFFFYRNEDRKRALLIALSIAGVGVAFLAARYGVLSSHHANNAAHIDMVENALANKHLSAGSRLATAVLMLGYYIRLLIVPYPLRCDYSFSTVPYVHFSNVLVLLVLVVYLALIVFAVYKLVKGKKDLYAFGILFFLVNLALFANVFFLVGATMAERFLFFASAGFCFVAALLLGRLAGSIGGGIADLLKNKKMLAVLVPVCGAYAVIAADRNGDWSDNNTLYRTDLAKTPENCRLSYYVGDILVDNNEYPGKDMSNRAENIRKSQSYLRRAVSLYPEYVNAELDLGYGFTQLQQFDSAEVHLLLARQLDPKMVLVNGNLAQLYFVTGRFSESMKYNKILMDLIPQNADVYTNTGLCFMQTKQYDSVVYYLKKGAAIHPEMDVFYANLAYTYKEMHVPDSAARYDAIVQQMRQRAGQ